MGGTGLASIANGRAVAMHDFVDVYEVLVWTTVVVLVMVEVIACRSLSRQSVNCLPISPGHLTLQSVLRRAQPSR